MDERDPRWRRRIIVEFGQDASAVLDEMQALHGHNASTTCNRALYVYRLVDQQILSGGWVMFVDPKTGESRRLLPASPEIAQLEADFRASSPRRRRWWRRG